MVPTEGDETPETIRLVVDTKQRRPACVLLQAAYGIDHRGLIVTLFDPQTWILAPTDDLHTVDGTLEQWRSFAGEVNERFKRPA